MTEQKTADDRRHNIALIIKQPPPPTNIHHPKQQSTQQQTFGQQSFTPGSRPIEISSPQGAVAVQSTPDLATMTVLLKNLFTVHILI